MAISCFMCSIRSKLLSPVHPEGHVIHHVEGKCILCVYVIKLNAFEKAILNVRECKKVSK